MTHIKTKIKKNDEVIVIAGRSKGHVGKVLRVEHRPNGTSRVWVEGANIMKKAVRPNPNKGERGGIKELEAPTSISNVKLYSSIEKKGERIGYKVLEDGRKVRYFKSSGELVDADQV